MLMLKFTVMVMLKLKFIIWNQVYFADRREKVDCKTTESAVARAVVTAGNMVEFYFLMMMLMMMMMMMMMMTMTIGLIGDLIIT